MSISENLKGALLIAHAIVPDRATLSRGVSQESGLAASPFGLELRIDHLRLTIHKAQI